MRFLREAHSLLQSPTVRTCGRRVKDAQSLLTHSRLGERKVKTNIEDFVSIAERKYLRREATKANKRKESELSNNEFFLLGQLFAKMRKNSYLWTKISPY